MDKYFFHALMPEEARAFRVRSIYSGEAGHPALSEAAGEVPKVPQPGGRLPGLCGTCCRTDPHAVTAAWASGAKEAGSAAHNDAHVSFMLLYTMFAHVCYY